MERVDYKPKFYTTIREGKVALWVKMPDGKHYNIWDIPRKQFTPEMKRAVVSAFQLGGRAMRHEVEVTFRRESISSMTTEDRWEGEVDDEE